MMNMRKAYGVPEKIEDVIRGYLFPDQLDVIDEFGDRFVFIRPSS